MVGNNSRVSGREDQDFLQKMNLGGRESQARTSLDAIRIVQTRDDGS